MIRMKVLPAVFFSLLCGVLGAQQFPFTLANEELIFSFQMPSGKKCSISVEEYQEYIIYRYGTKERIELQYPAVIDQSWELFTLETYSRGGGAANEGLSTEYLSFINNGYKYIIYEEYSAVSDKTYVGIRIITPDGDEIDLEGIPETKKGSIGKLSSDEHPIEDTYY